MGKGVKKRIVFEADGSSDEKSGGLLFEGFLPFGCVASILSTASQTLRLDGSPRNPVGGGLGATPPPGFEKKSVEKNLKKVKIFLALVVGGGGRPISWVGGGLAPPPAALATPFHPSRVTMARLGYSESQQSKFLWQRLARYLGRGEWTLRPRKVC